MKVGDIVMYTNTKKYPMFYGQIGMIENYTEKGSDGQAHCRVRWLQSVRYHTGYTTVSDFPVKYFSIINKDKND